MPERGFFNSITRRGLGVLSLVILLGMLTLWFSLMKVGDSGRTADSHEVNQPGISTEPLPEDNQRTDGTPRGPSSESGNPRPLVWGIPSLGEEPASRSGSTHPAGLPIAGWVLTRNGKPLEGHGVSLTRALILDAEAETSVMRQTTSGKSGFFSLRIRTRRRICHPNYRFSTVSVGQANGARRKPTGRPNRSRRTEHGFRIR